MIENKQYRFALGFWKSTRFEKYNFVTNFYYEHGEF